MRSLLLFEQGRTPTSKMARPAVLFRLRVKDGLAEYIEVRQVRPSNRTDEVIHLNAYVRSWWLVQTGQVGGFIENVSPCCDCHSRPHNDRCRRCDMLSGYCDVAKLLMDRRCALLVKPASFHAFGRAPGH
jgi:hypothetical protein